MPYHAACYLLTLLPTSTGRGAALPYLSGLPCVIAPLHTDPHRSLPLCGLGA